MCCKKRWGWLGILAGSEGKCSEALVELTSFLSEEQRIVTSRESLGIILEIRNQGQKYEALIALIPHLPEEQHGLVLQEVMTVVREKKISEDALKVLAPYLSEEMHGEALTLVQQIEDDWRRIKLEISMFPKLLKEQ